MDHQDLLIKAAETKTAVDITLDYAGRGNDPITITMHPYMVGDDDLQFSFVWGFVPHTLHFTRVLLHFVEKVKLRKDKFELQPSTVYYYADGEDIWGSVPEMYEKPIRVYSDSGIVGPEDLQ